MASNDLDSTGPVQFNMRLRAILDNAVEQLPPLLELGEVPATLTGPNHYDFPHHRPSVLSLATAMSDIMPQAIGFVLLHVRHIPSPCDLLECGAVIAGVSSWHIII